MHDERSHPLLQQTPLTVNPFIHLPKPPTLAHNYASIPSTLPPSALSAPATATQPDLPAYVTSSSGFAAHPSTIIAQNKLLLEQIASRREEGGRAVDEWREGIAKRDLAEKRRKAPGWLDSERKMLEPEKSGTLASPAPSTTRTVVTAGMTGGGTTKNIVDDHGNVIDGGEEGGGGGEGEAGRKETDAERDDLGAAMDRAFG